MLVALVTVEIHSASAQDAVATAQATVSSIGSLRSGLTSNAQQAAVKVGAIANVAEHVLVVAEGLLAHPRHAFAAQLGEACGLAIHPQRHEMATNARHRARAFGHAGAGVVRAARAEPGQALAFEFNRLHGRVLGAQHRQMRLDARTHALVHTQTQHALRNGLGDQGQCFLLLLRGVALVADLHPGRINQLRLLGGGLLAGVVGIVVHDHWKPYYTMQGVVHALCNAHHLRELKALVEIEKEDWARKMQQLLRRACHAANLARERGIPLKPPLIACFERRYDAILAEGLAFHGAQAPLACAASKSGRKRRGRAPRRTGHNLLSRFAIRKADTLRFLHDPSVPFTNNEAERDGRMMKLRQKISGGFRSMEGAVDFAIIRSFVSTARKQGWNLIDALSSDPENLAKSLRIA